MNEIKQHVLTLADAISDLEDQYGAGSVELFPGYGEQPMLQVTTKPLGPRHIGIHRGTGGVIGVCTTEKQIA